MRDERQLRSTRSATRCGLFSTMAIEFDAAPFLAALGVILFDVPGVPGARLVLRIEPQLIAAPGERLALRRFVDEAGDRPVVADLDLAASRFRAGACRSTGPAGGASAARPTTVTPSGGTIASAATKAPSSSVSRSGRGDSDGLTTTSASSIAPFGALSAIAASACRCSARPAAITPSSSALGVLIDFAHARAGQDVVELVLEQHPPVRLEALRRRRAEEMGERSGGLGCQQRRLGAAMAALDAALRRQRRAVQFEIDLAAPGRRRVGRRGAGVGAGEEVVDPRPARAGQGGQLAHQPLVVDPLRRRTAAAVAVADRQQRLGMTRLAAEIGPGRRDAARPRFAVVAIDGIVERVGEHAAAVEPLPPEQIVRKLIGLRPRHLGGDERVDAALAQQLRQRRREAEAVGQPADAMRPAERALEIALAVEDLSRQAFAARHVGVGLDP